MFAVWWPRPLLVNSTGVGGFGDYIHGIKVRCRVGGLGLGVGGVYASIWVGTID